MRLCLLICRSGPEVSNGFSDSTIFTRTIGSANSNSNTFDSSRKTAEVNVQHHSVLEKDVEEINSLPASTTNTFTAASLCSYRFAGNGICQAAF